MKTREEILHRISQLHIDTEHWFESARSAEKAGDFDYATYCWKWEAVYRHGASQLAWVLGSTTTELLDNNSDSARIVGTPD